MVGRSTFKAKNFESMTWQEVIDASGGRREGGGNNSHEVPVENLIPEARKRLKELNYNDLTLFFHYDWQGASAFGVLWKGEY